MAAPSDRELLSSFQLLPAPGSVLPDKSPLYKEAYQLNAEFMRLLEDTISSLESSSASLEKIMEYVMIHLETLYFPLTSESVASLKSFFVTSSFSDLPRILEPHVSWYNYELLDLLTALFVAVEVPGARFGWMAYRERMKEYGAMYGLEKISNKCLPFGKKEACECHRLNVSFSFNCLHLLLHHVHHIKRTVATGLGRPSCPLYLTTITQRHGIEFCFLLPKLLYKELFPLGEWQLDILREAGVLRVECGKHKYLVSEVSPSHSSQTSVYASISPTDLLCCYYLFELEFELCCSALEYVLFCF